MDQFFENRLGDYDEHMLNTIEGAKEFYKFTAAQLPGGVVTQMSGECVIQTQGEGVIQMSGECVIQTQGEGVIQMSGEAVEQLREEMVVQVLDLGCGTGLELEEYFALNPHAQVTGIDLSEAMLQVLAAKFLDKKLELIRGSYFDVDFGCEKYDAAVSVESLHHFTPEQKLGLYRKLWCGLKKEGYFVLTDYFAEAEALEKEYFETLQRLKLEQGIADEEFYHYDTPLTVEHEVDVLKAAGFADVKILKNWVLRLR